MYLVCGLGPFLDDFRSIQNFGAHTRVYAGKWPTIDTIVGWLGYSQY